MNEPLSLFDWGVFRTETRIAELSKMSVFADKPVFHTGAWYDFDTDQIYIHIMFTGDYSEAMCNERLRNAKSVFLNFTWDENQHAAVAEDVMTHLFSHPGGYRNTGTPKDLGKQLAKISVFQVSILEKLSDGSSLKPRIKCRSGLTSKVVSYEKN